MAIILMKYEQKYLHYSLSYLSVCLYIY